MAHFNSNINDAKYVGYMYGGAAGVASTSRNGVPLGTVGATTNETSSTIKISVDNWYQTKILGTQYEEFISDTLFCNDRQLQSEVGGAATGPGYGNAATIYASFYRLDTYKNPTLKCAQKNDRFTVVDELLGNGALTYPVALITGDEAMLAGLTNKDNSTNFLYTDIGWWTMGASRFYNGGKGVTWYTYYGSLYGESFYASNTMAVRPVINLIPQVAVTGTGTELDPFKVIT